MDFLLTLSVLLIILAAVYGVLLWARKAETDRSANVGLYLLYGIPGLLLTVTGVALLANGHEDGWFVLAFGLAFSLPLIRGFRKLLSYVTPLDPASPIDMMGLGVIFALFAYFSYAMSLGPADEPIEGVTVGAQLINVLFFVAVAYVAVGTGNYRNVDEVTARLGFTRPTLQDFAVGAAAVVPTFGLSILGSMLTLWFQPDRFEDLGETMEEMASGTDFTIVSLLIFASAGIGEEILFRGAIQPRFGIVITAALWALVHTQYQLTFVVLGLFLAGILFGLIRKYMSTTPAIIAHALYNAAVVALQGVG
ncbi:MAG TPA: CPBP family intramembrane glutamic endopeptidase [Thermomicrobiales bacterium]|nr:CPBP family intramembrane glutamic endopeptidase [Thermomicrobiales bacterium]